MYVNLWLCLRHRLICQSKPACLDATQAPGGDGQVSEAERGPSRSPLDPLLLTLEAFPIGLGPRGGPWKPRPGVMSRSTPDRDLHRRLVDRLLKEYLSQGKPVPTAVLRLKESYRPRISPSWLLDHDPQQSTRCTALRNVFRPYLSVTLASWTLIDLLVIAMSHPTKEGQKVTIFWSFLVHVHLCVCVR